MEYNWDVCRFLRFRPRQNTKLSGKTAKVNEVLEMSLPERSPGSNGDAFNPVVTAIIERVDDVEFVRFFRNGRESDRVCFYGKNEYLVATKGYSSVFRQECFGESTRICRRLYRREGETLNKIVIQNHIGDDMRSEKLKQVYGILTDCPVYTRQIFIAAVRDKKIEQLCKVGLYGFAVFLLSGNKTENEKDLFCQKSKSLYGKMGLTRYQATTLDRAILADNSCRIDCRLANFIECCEGVKANTISDERSDELIKLYGKFKIESFDTRSDYAAFVRDIIPEEIPVALHKQYINRLMRSIKASDLDVYHIVKDALSARRYLNEKPTFEMSILDSEWSVANWHDACVALRNEENRRMRERTARENAMTREERNKRNAELLAETDERMGRKAWEYEDDKVIIRLPKTPVEIINEGVALNHCVGGYTDSHSSGDTTIMFLRDKADPDKSLATIEVRYGAIQQIHLKHNAWLGTRPEYIPSVMKFIKQNNFRCTDQILLSTATGYSAGRAPLVEKPEI